MSKNAGLTEVPRINRHCSYDQKWTFGEGNVRKAFQRVFSPDSDYVLFQTIANQEAVDVLGQYVASHEIMRTPWNFKRLQLENKPRYILKASDKDDRLQFDNRLVDSYQRAIDRIAEESLGSENYSHYSMVITDGVHNLDRDPNAIFWPRVYIVNAEQCEGLKGIIDNLPSDETFKVMEELESPQFYQMSKIELLHDLKIKPLVILPTELKVGAQDLSKYVDFLAQMTETYEWMGPVIDIG